MLNESESDDFSENELDEMGNDPELLGDFVVEAREHLTNIEMRLLLLDREPANVEALHAIFRGFHTIKGLAGFLNLSALAEVAHEIETLFDLARTGELAITSGHVDVILEGSDYLARRLDELSTFLRTGMVPGRASNPARVAPAGRIRPQERPGAAPRRWRLQTQRLRNRSK